MFADGDGVKIDKQRAYNYFRKLIFQYGLDSFGTPEAPFVAKSYVALGLSYLEGIPGVLKTNPIIAHELFHDAASSYPDPEAQYYLGLLYLAVRSQQRRVSRSPCSC